MMLAALTLDNAAWLPAAALAAAGVDAVRRSGESDLHPGSEIVLGALVGLATAGAARIVPTGVGLIVVIVVGALLLPLSALEKGIDAAGFRRMGERDAVRPDGTTRRSVYWEMTKDEWVRRHRL